MIDELLPTSSIPKVVQILDWYHASEHVWKVGKLLKGTEKNGSPSKAAFSWVKGILDYMERGEISNILQRLKKIKKGSESVQDEIRKLIQYIETHRTRLRYGQFRKQNLIIGSGAIESVHKWVIQARCKLPGMRWSCKGINAMLRLRCLWASARWDEIFSLPNMELGSQGMLSP